MLKRGIIATMLAIAVLISGGVAAQAGAGKCDLSYSCLWLDRSYDGKSYGTARTKTQVTAAALRKEASSAGANGQTCAGTRFYEGWNLINGNPKGKYFTLFSETLLKKNYRDPNLSNGAGTDGVGINWEDRVDAIQHIDCK